MLEGPVHHAIEEGWWSSIATYLSKNKEVNQEVIGVLNHSLKTGLEEGFEKGASVGSTEIEKIITELPKLVKKHEALVELIRDKSSRKSKRAAEISQKILEISAIYTQINFQFVALWIGAQTPEIADYYLDVMMKENWIHNLYNSYVKAYNDCLETSNWRPFMNDDMRFPNNIDFHILKLAKIYSDFPKNIY